MTIKIFSTLYVEKLPSNLEIRVLRMDENGETFK